MKWSTRAIDINFMRMFKFYFAENMFWIEYRHRLERSSIKKKCNTKNRWNISDNRWESMKIMVACIKV